MIREVAMSCWLGGEFQELLKEGPGRGWGGPGAGRGLHGLEKRPPRGPWERTRLLRKPLAQHQALALRSQSVPRLTTGRK